MNPLGGAFGQSVALSCSGLPTAATCGFSPSSVVPGSNGASSTLTLSRSEHPYDLSVTAPGKVAWHISYVPRADEALDVNLRDEAAPPPKVYVPEAELPHKIQLFNLHSYAPPPHA